MDSFNWSWLTHVPPTPNARIIFFFLRLPDEKQSVAESGMNNIDDDEEISIERKRQRRKEEDFYSRLL